MQGTEELKSVESTLTKEGSPSRHAHSGRVMWEAGRGWGRCVEKVGKG